MISYVRELSQIKKTDSVSSKKQWFQTETASSQAEKLYQIPCKIKNFFLTLQSCTESIVLHCQEAYSSSMFFIEQSSLRATLRFLNFSKNGSSRQLLLWGIISTLANDQNHCHEWLLSVRRKKKERKNHFLISHSQLFSSVSPVVLQKGESSSPTLLKRSIHKN